MADVVLARDSVAAGVSIVAAGDAPVADWRRLADSAAEDNLFFHPDFALPATAGLGRAVEIAVVRGARGRLVAAAPFTRSRLGRIASAVRLWGHEYGPLGTPLVADDALAEGVSALVEGLAPAGAGGSLIVPDVGLDGPVAGALAAAARASGRPLDVIDRHQRAVRQRAEGDVKAALARKRRREFDRQLRRLGETGAVLFQTAREATAVAAAFEQFIRLEAAGWKGRSGSAMAHHPEIARFAGAAVAERARAGAAQIDTLSLEGRPVAIVVSMIAGSTAFTWKIAYDEAQARFSPGVQAMLRAGETLFENSAVRTVDSCATANHPMIDRLWPGRKSIGTMVIGPPGGGILHRLGLAAAATEVGARAAARRLRG